MQTRQLTRYLVVLSRATNYKIPVNETCVALRVYSEDTTTEQFLRETSLYQHASSLGIGPEVRFFDTGLLCIATSFVETTTFRWQRKLSDSQLKELAKQIKTIHDAPFTLKTTEQTSTGLPLTALKSAERLGKELNLSTLNEIISLL